MVKLFSVAEMKSLENEANQSGLTYERMMENAGRGLAVIINDAYSHLSNRNIIGLVGSGNNGGDTLVALEQLILDQWVVYAYVVRKRPDTDPYIERLRAAGGNIYYLEEDIHYFSLTKLINTSSILIDGIFGTGIKLPLNGEIVNLLSYVKKLLYGSQNKVYIVAVDCPSGVDCDTGDVAPETIQADITCTMAGLKHGLIKFPAASMVGGVRFVRIGHIEDFKTYKDIQSIVLSDDLVKENLPERPLNSHKGTFGIALIIAGSAKYTGAAYLAGMAAYRIGVGLVTLAVPAVIHTALAGKFPESTWILLPHEDGVISVDGAKLIHKQIDQVSALLIGPGIGLADTTKEFLRELFTMGLNQKNDKYSRKSSNEINDDRKRHIPTVVDADGLKILAGIENWPGLLASPAVLTPHPGEMALLTGLPIKEVQEDRIEIAKRYSALWGHVVVLKGAFTVIANPSGEIAVVPIATPALAKAGTGDVLAGLIVGLLAQGMNAFQSACAAAWIHANAGLLASKQLGNTTSVIASDVLNTISRVISSLE